MRHGRKNRKFGRETKQRNALMRDLARALILNGKITTTEAKAKSLKTFADKLVTLGKKGDLPARRTLAARAGQEVAKKLISEIGPRFRERSGGYTRIIKMPPRVSDGAAMAVIEIIQ